MSKSRMSQLAERSHASTEGRSDPLIAINNLEVTFARPDRSSYAVVRGVSFSLGHGEIVGLVGESGSGKSLTARLMMGLLPRGGKVSGSVFVEGKEILDMPHEDLRAIRGQRVAMVFQDPMTSFNPVQRIGDQLGEAVTVHKRTVRAALREHVLRALSQVGILNPAERSRAFPHEFSGGMRQRALLAMSTLNNPSLLIADEPTTALDVTVQDQILELLRGLNEDDGTAILLITHNIALVASLCERMVVMYAGCIVEDGPAETVLRRPQHPYTWMLLKSLPRIDERRERLIAIEGQPPDPANMPAGCKFHPRCPFAVDRCRIEEPHLDNVGDAHSARCFVLMDNIDAEVVARV